nr:toxin regulator [uncultured Anaerosporobacter sp.]
MKEFIIKHKFAIVVIICIIFCIGATEGGISQESYDTLVNQNDRLNKEIEFKDSKIQELNNEIASLNEKYEPYKDLSVAEANAAKAEQELKEEKDRKELEKIQAKEQKEKEEKEAKEQKEKEEKEAKEKAEKEKEEKLGYETGITFSQLARTPDNYEGKLVKFKGKVLQVMETDSEIQIRLAVDSDYDKVILCGYLPDTVSSRVLEDDVITIYGSSLGLTSYKSTLGGTITIPTIWVDKIDQ